jgi:hypothetical protein
VPATVVLVFQQIDAGKLGLRTQVLKLLKKDAAN